MILKGLDEAWAKVDPAYAYSQGYRFIIGYVSEDPTKNLSANDIARIHAANMAVAFVYEYDTNAALDGYPTGVANARVALGLFAKLGVPTGVACYTAGTDFNVQPGQMSTCLSYETGFADTMHAVGYRYGAYTGYPFAAYLTQHNYSGFIWQTYAWSNGAWLAAAAIRQTQNGVHVAGIDVDIDESEIIDFGQWETKMADDTENALVAYTRLDTIRQGLDRTEPGATYLPAAYQNEDFTGLYKRIAVEVIAQLPAATSSGLSTEDKALLQSTLDAVNALNSRLATP